jgi:hypothetical protein
MPFTHSHVSLSEWKEEAWECFFHIEKSFPLSQGFELSGSVLFSNKLLELIYYSSFTASIDHDQLRQFSLFILFLLKSTLFFDRSFSLDMKDKESKLILMHADLYLVQGGIEFSRLDQHQRCQSLLEETLNRLAIHHQVMNSNKNLSTGILETLSQRYGALVYCSIVGIFLISGKSDFPKELLYSLSKIYGLLLCLEYHELVSLSQKDSPLQMKYSKQLVSIINSNPKELAFLNSLSSDLERKVLT